MSEKITYSGYRMRKRDAANYAKLYGFKTTGIQEAIDSFLHLRMHTIREIRGRFSKNELTAMTDYLHHMPIEDPINRINKDTLISHIQNSEEWNNLEVKNRISYDDLIFKIKQLTAAQVYFLQSEIARYWKVNKGKRYNIDAFIETLE